MNRAERRRIKRAAEVVDNPIYYKMTVQDIDNLKRSVAKEVESNCIKILFSVPMAVGKNKYGWSDEQCQQFAEDICEEYDRHINGESMTIDEYVKFTEKVTGIRFE